MLCIFVHDTSRNKLYIIGYGLSLSLAVKFTRNKSRRAWSVPVLDSGKTVKGLKACNTLLIKFM